jgi:hypothetical protein
MLESKAFLQHCWCRGEVSERYISLLRDIPKFVKTTNCYLLSSPSYMNHMADRSLLGQPWPDVLATSQTATIIYLLALSIAFVYLRHTAKLASGRNSVVSLLEQSHAAAASQLISYKGRTGKSSTSMLIDASDGCSIYIYHERCFSIFHGTVVPDNSREER